MATEKTPEDALKETVKAMGEPLGRLFHALNAQVAWLHVKWRNFRTLYGHTEKRIGVLNRVAPAFFHYLQESSHEAVVMHLCRITDPPRTGSHDNLTVQQFIGQMDTPAREGHVASIVDTISVKVDFARKWRNLRLAHLDLQGLLGGPSRTLPPSDLKSVDSALAAIRELMNYVHGQFMPGSIGYEHTMDALGGVESFVSFLERFEGSL